MITPEDYLVVRGWEFDNTKGKWKKRFNDSRRSCCVLSKALDTQVSEDVKAQEFAEYYKMRRWYLSPQRK